VAQSNGAEPVDDCRGFEILDRARLPGGGEMTLRRKGGEFEIFVGDRDLMSSRVHGSEESLARFGCRNLSRAYRPRVLVGGLGLGYTLAAVLKEVPPSATVVVAERVAEVVHWNRGVLGPLAGRPLDDPRVELFVQDVAVLLRTEDQAFDAILLDVDNGPFALSVKENRCLYSEEGVRASLRALRRDGVMAIWSSTPDPSFQRMLRRMGLAFRTQQVSAGDSEQNYSNYLHMIHKR